IMSKSSTRSPKKERRPGPEPAAPPSGSWPTLGVPGMVLAGLAFVVLFPVVHHDFVNMDDPSYIEDVHVKAGLTWQGVAWAFTTWHPLTWLSHMLDVQLFGASASGPHLVNLLLHSGSLVLCFVV